MVAELEMVLHEGRVLLVSGEGEGQDLGIAGSSRNKGKERSQEGGGEVHGSVS